MFYLLVGRKIDIPTKLDTHWITEKCPQEMDWCIFIGKCSRAEEVRHIPRYVTTVIM